MPVSLNINLYLLPDENGSSLPTIPLFPGHTDKDVARGTDALLSLRITQGTRNPHR